MKLSIGIAVAFVITKVLIGGQEFLDVALLTFAIVFGLIVFSLFDAFRPRPKVFNQVAWIGVLLLILFTVIVPTIGFVSLRHANGPATNVHDNPIQIEAAIDFLLHAKNPYVETYYNTPLAEWNGGMVHGITNPALDHVIALPGHLIMSLLARLPMHALFGFYDERMFYLIVFILMLWLASRLGKSSEHRLRSVVLLGLNPLLVPFLIFGRNDVLVFTVLLAAFLCLADKRGILAAFLFGLACTVKLFAVAFAPAFLVVLIAQAKGMNLSDRLRASIVPVLVCALTFLALILPFVLWNPSAFYDDVIRYTNGTSATSYPIVGYGLSKMLLNLGVIRTQTDSYPFWILQTIAVVPLLVLFLPKLARKPSASLMVFVGTFILFTFMFFSRFMNDNYFGLVSLLAFAGYGFSLRERSAAAAP